MTFNMLVLYMLFSFASTVFGAADLSDLLKRMTAVEKQIQGASTYCQLHAKSACGSCICKDDFNTKKKFYCDCQHLEPERDCLEFYRIKNRVNGIYTIHLNNYRKVPVYCDLENGGWTVIQRRYDGSQNFYRSWEEYKQGFGELQREFWLGNENIHLLTTQAIFPKGSECMINIQFFSRPSFNDHYGHFLVSSEKTKYLVQVSDKKSVFDPKYNMVDVNNNMAFSTYDQDNDKSSGNCAKDRNYGGWWYNNCGDDTNLNGPYDKYHTRSWYSRFNLDENKLRGSEIKVRRLD